MARIQGTSTGSTRRSELGPLASPKGMVCVLPDRPRSEQASVASIAGRSSV
jgi:hypothetical protein